MLQQYKFLRQDQRTDLHYTIVDTVPSQVLQYALCGSLPTLYKFALLLYVYTIMQHLINRSPNESEDSVRFAALDYIVDYCIDCVCGTAIYMCSH